MKYLLNLALILFIGISPIHAQKFLKKIAKATTSKITNKAENLIIDELSTRLANAAVKPLDSAMDDYVRESYEESTGEKYDTANVDEMSRKINAYLESITKDVKYESSYTFNAEVEIETKDYGSKKGERVKLLGSDKSYSAIKQESDGKSMIIIMDEANNSMISIDQTNNSAMALPLNMNIMRSSLSSQSTQSESVDMSNMPIKKINKTKKVLNHTSYGYRYEDEEYRSDVYLSGSFPVSWADAFGGAFKDYVSNFYRSSDGQMDLSQNMIMFGESTRKSDSQKSTWEVVDFDDNPAPINTSNYTFSNLYQND